MIHDCLFLTVICTWMSIAIDHYRAKRWSVLVLGDCVVVLDTAKRRPEAGDWSDTTFLILPKATTHLSKISVYHLYCVCASSGESINFGTPERLKWRRPFVLAWGPPLIVVVQTVLITREKMLQSDYIQIPVFERNMQGHKALLPLCRNCFSSFFSFAFNSSCIICHCAVSFSKFYSVVMCDCHV